VASATITNSCGQRTGSLNTSCSSFQRNRLREANKMATEAVVTAFSFFPTAAATNEALSNG